MSAPARPTTGVVAGDRFYFVATSQFGAVGPEGLDEAALVDTLVMWVPLARPERAEPGSTATETRHRDREGNGSS